MASSVAAKGLAISTHRQNTCNGTLDRGGCSVAAMVASFPARNSRLLTCSTLREQGARAESNSCGYAGLGGREAVVLGKNAWICGTSLPGPAFADSYLNSKSETQTGIKRVKTTLALEKSHSAKAAAVATLRLTSNDSVAKKRRENILPGDYDDNPMEKWFRISEGDADSDDEEDGDMLREECGVVGIFGDSEASRLCYLSLHALQHRGQEGAGIVACEKGSLRSVTGMGLVSEVFNQSALSKLTGTSAVGHVRYATAGESVLKNVQPFVAEYRFGSVGVAHNGNLVNYNELRAMLEEDGSIFNTSSDTEVVLHLIAMSKARPFLARLVDACQQLEGAYSMVFLTEDKLVAVRDPYGFRPLVMGHRSNGAIVFASETCALDLIEATYEREINPGEVVVVDKEGISSLCLMPQRQRKACVFEHIYFALPNSIVFGLSVYQSRYRIGEVLATETPVECDVVIAVPDSGVVAALGYASKAGVPFQQGLIRSHYVGRTFIEPSQKIRDFGVKLKLAPVKAVLQGKRVVVVDDSIVRGTTSSKIVRLIKEAGATEVHLRIASPPITGSCYYGVDTPSKEELISYRFSLEETRKYIGADSLAFLPLESLSGMLGVDSPNFCYACFTGDYPVPPKTLSKDAVEKETAHKVLVDGLTDSWSRGNSNNLPNPQQEGSYGSGVSDAQGEEIPSVPLESRPLPMEAHAGL